MLSFKELLSRKLLELDWPPGKLAQTVGLSSSQIRRLLRGSLPQPRTLSALTAGLCLSPEERETWRRASRVRSRPVLKSNPHAAGARSRKADLSTLWSTAEEPARDAAASIIGPAEDLAVLALNLPVHSCIIPAAGRWFSLLAHHVVLELLAEAIFISRQVGFSETILVTSPDLTPMMRALQRVAGACQRLIVLEQRVPTGLGEAVYVGWGSTSGGPSQGVAVLLPDDLLHGRGRGRGSRILAQMCSAYPALARSCDGAAPCLIAVETPVPEERVSRAGIARLELNAADPNLRRIAQLVEKPAPGHEIVSPVNRDHLGAVVGRYLCPPSVYANLLELRKAGVSIENRLELTDALARCDHLYALTTTELYEDARTNVGAVRAFISRAHSAAT